MVNIYGIATSHPTNNNGGDDDNKLLMVAPMPGDETVSSEWMEFILKDNSVIPQHVRVESVSMKDLNENRGFNGIMKRLTVVYQSTTSDDQLPTSFILKRSDNSEQGRNNVLKWKPHREALFYANRDLLEKVPLGPSSSLLYSYGNGQVGEYVILMKDLQRKQTVGVNMVFGNQIWGVPTFDFELPQPLDTLKQMYAGVAKTHAKFWNDSSLFQYEFLKSARFYDQKDKELWEEGMEKTRKGWEISKKRNSESKELNFSEKLVNIIEKSMQKASWESFQEEIKKEPFTLCHGDFHGSNFLLDVATGQLNALDWTEVGLCTGVTDLVQTLISDIKPELYVHTKDLVTLYWDELVKNGVSPSEYPFEKCWQSFCRDGFERWIWLLTILCEMTNVPDICIQFFHDQMMAFIEQHGEQEYYVMKTVV